MLQQGAQVLDRSCYSHRAQREAAAGRSRPPRLCSVSRRATRKIDRSYDTPDLTRTRTWMDPLLGSQSVPANTRRRKRRHTGTDRASYGSLQGSDAAIPSVQFHGPLILGLRHLRDPLLLAASRCCSRVCSEERLLRQGRTPGHRCQRP